MRMHIAALAGLPVLLLATASPAATLPLTAAEDALSVLESYGRREVGPAIERRLEPAPGDKPVVQSFS